MVISWTPPRLQAAEGSLWGVCPWSAAHPIGLGSGLGGLAGGESRAGEPTKERRDDGSRLAVLHLLTVQAEEGRAISTSASEIRFS